MGTTVVTVVPSSLRLYVLIAAALALVAALGIADRRGYNRATLQHEAAQAEVERAYIARLQQRIRDNATLTARYREAREHADGQTTGRLLLKSTGPRAPAPAASGGGGLGGLSELTTLHFSLGPARFTVELPSSVAVRLPVPLQGARTLEFNLSAEASGRFSLSIRVNGLRHVQIEARAGVEVGERERATFGLTISTTRTICRRRPLPVAVSTTCCG